MADSALTGLCRIEVRAGGASFELAVPTDVPLGDLLPAIVDHAAAGAGEDLHERGLRHQGWILQRLGGEPLGEDHTPAALGLRDGDRLYLRPRADHLPPVHFDDLVDGISSTLRDRADSWRPAATRYALLTGTAAVLAGCLPLLLVAVPGGARVPALLGVAVLLLLGAAAASRAVGDLPAGALLGLAAVAYLAVAGALVAGGSPPGSRLAAGAAAGVGGAVLALAAVGAAAEVFLGVAAGGVLLTAGGVAVLAGGVPVAGAAGLVAVLAVLFSLVTPMLGLRLAGLRIPPLPANAEELQEGIEPHPGPEVVARATLTDRYTTAFLLASGSVLTLCVLVLAGTAGVTAVLLGYALAVLSLLHARFLGGRWQRLAALVPGGGGVLWLTVLLAAGLPGAWRLGLLAGLLGLGAGLLVASWTLPGARLVPYWGRLAELLHTLFALSLVPLLLALLGVYGWARALF